METAAPSETSTRLYGVIS